MDFYVERMIADRWTDVHCHEDETVTPSVEDVEQAISMLDANNRTLVSLYGRDGGVLTIGGGAGRYVVYASSSDEQLWNLISKASETQSDIVMLNAGGQEGDFPARQVNLKPQVLQAARTFVQTGRLDSSLHWEKQS